MLWSLTRQHTQSEQTCIPSHTQMGSLDTAGPSQFGPDSQQPSSNGFGGFPLPSSSSPFFDAQQTSMADIFPSQSAALLQPATSQAPSNSISHWPSASGTASGTLPHQFSDQDRMLQVCRCDICLFCFCCVVHFLIIDTQCTQIHKQLVMNEAHVCSL